MKRSGETCRSGIAWMGFHIVLAAGAATFLAIPVLGAEPSVDELKARLETVTKEAGQAELELKATEGVIKEREAELMLLNILEGTLRNQLAALNPAGAGTAPVADLEGLREKLTKEATDKVALIRGGGDVVGMAFAFESENGIRIFTPAAVISDNPVFSVETIAGDPIEIGPEISCPTGVELIGLHPKQQPAPFQLLDGSQPPALGDPILVISYSNETEAVTGTVGRIRGIGPDVWELDADMTPDMIGSPVISLGSGKVIGIVAPQIEGVATEWAQGTRHQEARNFAARLDRIQDWKAIDLVRFRKESAHIRKFEHVTHITWVGHTLMTSASHEMKKYAEAESVANAANPLIKEATRWKGGSGNSGAESKGILYRNMLASLRAREDLSGKFSWYHERRYQLAREVREDAIRVVTNEIAKLDRAR